MTALGLLAMVLSLRIAISDLYARRVPNAWLLAASGAGVVILTALALSSPGIAVGTHVAGLVIGLLALLPFHLIRWMGAGDVKFFAVLGLLLGSQALLPVWIGASLLAGAHAIAVYAWRSVRSRLPLRVMSAQHALQERPGMQQMHAARQGRVGIPYAAYLGFSAIVWILWSVNGGQQ